MANYQEEIKAAEQVKEAHGLRHGLAAFGRILQDFGNG